MKMSEKEKFHNMTKPMKFRNVKKVLSYVDVMRERIIYNTNYLFNYILYKLNIYKRFNYRDNVVEAYDLTPRFSHLGIEYFNKTICTPILCVKVNMRCEITKHIEEDYFYFCSRKYGMKKKMVLKDIEESEVRLIGVIDPHIGFKLTNQDAYYFSQLPIFKMMEQEPLIVEVFNQAVPRTYPIPTKEYTINLDAVKKLRSVRVVGHDIDLVSTNELKYVYDLFVEQFEGILKEIKVNELMVVRK